MLYSTRSSKAIIGRLIRNLRVTDSSYINDLSEWMDEALRKLETTKALLPEFVELHVKNHKVRMPCGIANIDAVVYQGSRLRLGTAVTKVGHTPKILSNPGFGAVYTYNEQETIQNLQINRISGQDLYQVKNVGLQYEYYLIKLDYIQTSFCDGCIQLHYHKFATDDEGYPLVPDNDNYSEAIFWYLLAHMIMAGYEPNSKEFTYDYCINKFETYGRRGINEIKYWNIDEAEKVKQNTVRLVLPYSDYTDFSVGYEQIQTYNKL